MWTAETLVQAVILTVVPFLLAGPMDLFDLPAWAWVLWVLLLVGYVATVPTSRSTHSSHTHHGRSNRSIGPASRKGDRKSTRLNSSH